MLLVSLFCILIFVLSTYLAVKFSIPGRGTRRDPMERIADIKDLEWVESRDKYSKD